MNAAPATNTISASECIAADRENLTDVRHHTTLWAGQSRRTAYRWTEGRNASTQGGHDEIKRRRLDAGFCSCRCSGARGRHDQDRLYRPAFGRRRLDRGSRPQDLPISRRRDQRFRRAPRQEGRDRRVRQQDQSSREPDSGAKSGRPGSPDHHPGKRLFGGRGFVRLGQQIQRPQPRQGDHLSQLRCGRSRADQRQMLLLAFPLGREFRR